MLGIENMTPEALERPNEHCTAIYMCYKISLVSLSLLPKSRIQEALCVTSPLIKTPFLCYPRLVHSFRLDYNVLSSTSNSFGQTKLAQAVRLLT